MPYATASDKVRLYYEEAGSGTPILFSHEFAGDHRNWEPQMRFFARRHRCITYSCRGYKPSDIPADVIAYSYKHWISDAVAILDHLKIDKAHFVGLSQGGYTALDAGHPSSEPLPVDRRGGRRLRLGARQARRVPRDVSARPRTSSRSSAASTW